MSDRAVIALFLFLFLSLCLFGARHASSTSGTKPLIEITPDNFSLQKIIFHPGAFRVDELSNTVQTLCILSNGRWVNVHAPLSMCPILPTTRNPPPELVYERGPQPTDTPIWVAGNLGITREQWLRAREHAASDSSVVTRIAKAAEIALAPNGTLWSFNTSSLPHELRAEIPGSGIYFHIEDNLGESRAPELFSGDAGALSIEAKLAVPKLATRGSATTTLSIAVGMQARDMSGALAPLPLIVDLFNTRGLDREAVRTDGRNIYIASPLMGSGSFISHVVGEEERSGWEDRRLFAFEITRENSARMIEAVNRVRVQNSQIPLDPRPSMLRLKSLHLRNESRFLEHGDVQFRLETEYLRALSVRR